MKTPFVGLLLVGLLSTATIGFAQRTVQKIGFVNSSKIFDGLPEAKDATKRLESFSKPIQDSLALMQKQLEVKVDEYQKKEGMMTDAAKRQQQQEIQELQVQAREYAQTKDAELKKLQEKVVGPLKEKILRAIDAVAKREGYSFVFDQNEQINILLYADTRDDLTNTVLDKLIRGR